VYRAIRPDVISDDDDRPVRYAGHDLLKSRINSNDVGHSWRRSLSSTHGTSLTRKLSLRWRSVPSKRAPVALRTGSLQTMQEVERIGIRRMADLQARGISVPCRRIADQEIRGAREGRSAWLPANVLRHLRRTRSQ